MNITREKRSVINGILGTVIFHLSVAILILAAQVGKINKQKEVETFELELIDDLKKLEQLMKERDIAANGAMSADNNADNEKGSKFSNLESFERAKNIAINEANKLGKTISTDNYINQVKDEMGIKDLNPKHDNSLPDIAIDNNLKNKNSNSQPAEVYKGKTNITYNLKDRTKIKIPVPVYKCEGGGMVVIDIVVSPSGYVLESNVSSFKTKVTEQCLIQEALNSARLSRFNPDLKAEQRQKGTISFNFISQ